MSLDELIRQAEQLAPDQQLQLAAYLIESARKQLPAASVRPQWSDIRGSASYPLVGEDAQAWVSRTRHEGDEHREQVWRKSI